VEGADKPIHLKELLDAFEIDAVCAASIYHYQVIREFGVEKRGEGNNDIYR